MQEVGHFRANLKLALAVKGISQGALAIRLDTSRPYVNRILNCNVEPSLSACMKVADTIGIPLRDLLIEPEAFRNIVTPREAAS